MENCEQLVGAKVNGKSMFVRVCVRVSTKYEWPKGEVRRERREESLKRIG